MGYACAFLGCDTVPALLDLPVTSSATPPPLFIPTQTLGPQVIQCPHLPGHGNFADVTNTLCSESIQEMVFAPLIRFPGALSPLPYQTLFISSTDAHHIRKSLCFN